MPSGLWLWNFFVLFELSEHSKVEWWNPVVVVFCYCSCLNWGCLNKRGPTWNEKILATPLFGGDHASLESDWRSCFPNEWLTFSCSGHLSKLHINSSVLLIDWARQGAIGFGLAVLRQLGCALRGDIQSCDRGILGLPSHLAFVGTTVVFGGRWTLTEEYSIAMSCKIQPTSYDIRAIQTPGGEQSHRRTCQSIAWDRMEL